MRTHIGFMTSKFAWQLSDSIWITYWTIGHLGSLEVWYLINHLNCLNFISIAYLINFGSNAEKCGRSRGVKLYWFIFSGPKCSPMQGGLWWNWYLGKRAHPNEYWYWNLGKIVKAGLLSPCKMYKNVWVFIWYSF